jgi:hypothetical protein
VTKLHRRTALTDWDVCVSLAVVLRRWRS